MVGGSRWMTFPPILAFALELLVPSEFLDRLWSMAGMVQHVPSYYNSNGDAHLFSVFPHPVHQARKASQRAKFIVFRKGRHILPTLRRIRTIRDSSYRFLDLYIVAEKHNNPSRDTAGVLVFHKGSISANIQKGKDDYWTHVTDGPVKPGKVINSFNGTLPSTASIHLSLDLFRDVWRWQNNPRFLEPA
ncbi:hypothetical protein CEK25_009365 [Fusarium fujikuroi]|nr:hypothetical protein CEK25_009365 [Fusarium fujikuroi]